MGDILVLLGHESDASKGRRAMVDRPGMEHHTLNEYTRGWGRVLFQQSMGKWYAPAITDERILLVVGRPTVRGVKLGHSADAIGQWVLDSLGDQSLGQGAEEINQSLSGMYAIFEIADDRVGVLTDHMGFRPVYVARDEQDQVLGLGTHVESLAIATGQSTDIDLVSLGELFTYNHISFPFTTRKKIREIDPCSMSEVETSSGNQMQTRVLWEPTEPEEFVGKNKIRDQLCNALVEAGDDITRGCDRAAVLLSGGIDSRAVIGVIPKDRLSGALTYVTRENRETKVACQVSQACGIEHVLVHRSEDYFPNLINRGLGLLGMELRGNCHGICIFDADLSQSYDVVIGGQLSDTLLKDHFMPLPKRQRYQRMTLRSLLRRVLKGKPKIPTPSMSHTTGREILEASLTDDIQTLVRTRRKTRLNDVQRVRPTTADEWQRFWPCSRQDDSAHTLGNTRLMCSDTLFAHQAIVEVSMNFDPKHRASGKLTDHAFASLCGNLMEIINANTGLPANASSNAIRAKRKQDRIEKAQSEKNGVESKDWNQVETSWVNPVVMQRESAVWIDLREKLISSEAMNILSKVIARGGQVMVESYQDDLPSTSNHMAMQLSIWLDGILSTEQSDISEVVR